MCVPQKTILQIGVARRWETDNMFFVLRRGKGSRTRVFCVFPSVFFAGPFLFPAPQRGAFLLPSSGSAHFWAAKELWVGGTPMYLYTENDVAKCLSSLAILALGLDGS